MHLREYLSQPGAPSVAEVRQRMNALGAEIDHDAQIRQWASDRRRPNPANCLYLERATHGKVTRQAMRPTDYQAVWPELSHREPA